MNIAFVAFNPLNKYSGGRIHALTLAYAFAGLGYDVDYYTNNIPVFLKDIPDSIVKSKIHFICNKFFLKRKSEVDYEHIIVAPHLASKKSPIYDRFIFYPFVKLLKKKNKCPLWYIDFESPNWINEVNPAMRSMKAHKYSNKVLSSTDVILSTTKIGSEYAKKYYSQYNEELKFSQLYLCINTAVADKVDDSIERKDRIVFFGRFGQKHKKPDFILSVLEAVPEKYEVAIIGNNNHIDNDMLEKMNLIEKNINLMISYFTNISDFEKFELLAKSKLLIFNSAFEGYGIPPLESQYMGTPVLCSDIPVLKEVNRLAMFSNFENTEILRENICAALKSDTDSRILKDYVSSFASEAKFRENLNNIILEINDWYMNNRNKK